MRTLYDHLPELLEHWPEPLKSPCFILDETRLKENAAILSEIENQSGARILFALKAFSCYPTFHCFDSAAGTESSSLFEAILAKKYLPHHSQHVFSPAYNPDEFAPLLTLSEHLIFNSMSQWLFYRDKIAKSKKAVSVGLRLNPQFSVIEEPLYDPSSAYSGFGIPLAELTAHPDTALDGINGFHFHNLCEQNAGPLAATLAHLADHFSDYLSRPAITWLNFGGGHLLTSPDYDRDTLCALIQEWKNRFQVQIYLEPGEAWSYNAGAVISTVMDIRDATFFGGRHHIAFLNWSAINHLSDSVLMDHYSPPVRDAVILESPEADPPESHPHTYVLKGNTCAAGDRFGKHTVYAFPQPLTVGQPVVFTDMALYSLVKMTMFNGINKPQIALLKQNGHLTIHRQFTYSDFENSL